MASDSLPTTATAPADQPSRGKEADLELVRRMQAGDERALGEFYDRWHPVVSALAARMLKSADDVEDVIEETFWQAWRQANRFTAERGSVATWLLTIARSRALDRLRATRRLREDAIDVHGAERHAASGDSDFLAAPNDPARDVEQNERRTLVVAALAELPREQREALELGYFGGLSQSEIAERTGQPLGTVKTRMRLAMMKLRERLAVLRDDAIGGVAGEAR
ncbi:MAG TPA: sigma-70 family RNA polymerase sigma factor [Gemmatimonadaceae bacterium]|nr:sigma-70 family RNA polymerase sigma factor [Gemmatimonadaceae bacterium]